MKIFFHPAPNLTDTLRYEYNAYGMLRSHENAHGQTTTFTYDAAGRVITEVSPEMNLAYLYATSGAGKGQLEYIKTGSTELRKIEYGGLGLPVQITEKIDAANYITKYTYDSYGRLLQKESPSGFKLSHVYNGDGYLTTLRDAGNGNADIWQVDAINAFGQVTQSTLGNGLTRKTAYNSSNLTLQGITLKNGDTNVDEMTYNFTPSSGNLQQRNDATNARNETFGYDINRLNSITLNNGAAQSITYEPDGNINTKFDVGTYQYAGNNHAVSGISPLAPGYSPQAFDITHTSFNRPAQITEGAKSLVFFYSPSRQRNKSVYTEGSATVTRYYNGNYEKEVTSSTTKEFDYICSPEGLAAIAVKTGNTSTMYYAHTDHLGSLRLLTDANKSIQSCYHYDAWGKRTPVNGKHISNITNRGFTMHEHLDEFGLINMNARLYDPVLGRFLSPDQYVQFPDFSQSYNRYSYCLNNPLKHVDPSGKKIRPFNETRLTDHNSGSTGGGSGWLSAMDPTRTWGGFMIGFDGSYSPGFYAHFSGPSYSYNDILSYLFGSSVSNVRYNPDKGKIYGQYSYSIPGPLFNPITGAYDIVLGGSVTVGFSFSVENSWQNGFDFAGGLFNIAGGFGTGLQEMGGSFRLTNGAYNGSSWSPHHYKSAWTGGSTARITTYNSAKWGGRISGGAIGVGTAIGVYQIRQGYIADGNTFGYNALTTTGSVVVGMAGGWGGAVTGAGFGFAVAGPPGAIIGGIIGGFGVGWAGSYVGWRIVDLFY